MKLDDIRKLLRDENPKGRTSDIEMYSHHFIGYLEAAENIAQNGVLVSHPRTGQPMENPYLKVRANAESGMSKLKRLRVEMLWKNAASHIDSLTNATPSP